MTACDTIRRNKTKNTYLLKSDKMTLAEKAGWVICYVELTTGFILQSTAIYLLIAAKKRKPSNLLLLHLFAAQLMSIVWETCVIFSNLYLPYSSALKAVQLIGGIFVGYTRCQSVLWITVDRVLAIRLGFKYRVYATSCRVRLILLLMWVISMVHGIIAWLAPLKVTILILMVWNSGMLITVVTCYIYIITVVKRQRRHLNNASACIAIIRFKYQVPLTIAFFYTILCIVPKLTAYFNQVELGYSWLYVGLFFTFNTDPITYLLHRNESWKTLCVCYSTSQDDNSANAKVIRFTKVSSDIHMSLGGTSVSRNSSAVKFIV